MSLFRVASIVLIASSVAVAGCASTGGKKAAAAKSTTVVSEVDSNGGFQGLEKSGGLHLFGKKQQPSAQAQAQSQAGIGVNAYLWRAALDTLAFMPLASADPWGGVVITDWYSNPEKPDERFKATVYILDTRLRADALKVTVYKQVRDGSGGWVDSAVSDQTGTDLENSILTRARQLRLANVKG